MIVARGFKNPSTFHVDRLRNERAGYFFDVMTNGFGQMSSYAPQITPEDRWAVVAWVKTLQASQNMPKEFLTKGRSEDRWKARAGGGCASAAGEAPAAPSPHSPSKKSSSESSETR